MPANFSIRLGLFLLITLVNCQEAPKLSNEEETCLTDLKLNREAILKIHSKRIKEENNEEYNKFIACAYKKMGFMDEHGNLLVDAITQKLTGKLFNNEKSNFFITTAVETVIKACKGSPGGNEGRAAVSMQNCITNVLEEMKKPFTTQ